MSTLNSRSLPWDVVEKAINKEVKWLETIIETSPYNKEICKDYIFRRLAILIVSGKIKAKDIKSTVYLWGEEKLLPIGKPHGKEWHAKMMNLVHNYFKSLGYDVVIEPNLNMGRADLGAYRKNERNLFIEIGTVSASKLLFNLESMEESDFLLIIDEKHATEFSVLKAGYKYHSV